MPSVHTEWNKQEVNELVSGRAWLDRWHDIYLVACFPSAWLSPRGQFETFNLVSKPSPEPGGWTIHDGFRRAADTVYFRLHVTISVDARAWKNHAQRYLCGPSDPWSSPRAGAGNSLMLIYISCARYSRFDWAGWRLMKDPCVVFLDAYLCFPTLVYTCDSSSLCYIYPPFCLKVSNTASRIPYREASSHKTYLHYSEFCVFFFFFFCPVQRKWVRTLGFLIMRKPRFTFCTSSFDCVACALNPASFGFFN